MRENTKKNVPSSFLGGWHLSIHPIKIMQVNDATDIHNDEKYIEDENDSNKSDSIYELSIRTSFV